jgi:hypothetical protein
MRHFEILYFFIRFNKFYQSISAFFKNWSEFFSIRLKQIINHASHNIVLFIP